MSNEEAEKYIGRTFGLDLRDVPPGTQGTVTGVKDGRVIVEARYNLAGYGPGLHGHSLTFEQFEQCLAAGRNSFFTGRKRMGAN
jgi:hypothetical protein